MKRAERIERKEEEKKPSKDRKKDRKTHLEKEGDSKTRGDEGENLGRSMTWPATIAAAFARLFTRTLRKQRRVTVKMILLHLFIICHSSICCWCWCCACRPALLLLLLCLFFHLLLLLLIELSLALWPSLREFPPLASQQGEEGKFCLLQQTR